MSYDENRISDLIDGGIKKENEFQKQRSQFILPEASGDMSIFLMQNVALIIKANESFAYSEEHIKDFRAELVLALMELLEIDLDFLTMIDNQLKEVE